MTHLPIEKIRIDGGTQPRAEINKNAVEEYASLISEKVLMPPVIVYFDGKEYWLVDGFHRYFSHKKLGLTEMLVDIRNGTLREAQFFSKGAHNGRGLGHNSKDYEYIVLSMVKDKEWGQWSNRALGKHIGISAMTVGRIKKKADVQQSSKKKTNRKDGKGKEVIVDTSKMGRPEQTKPNEVEQLQQKIKELTTTVNEVVEENTQIKDQIAIGSWDASEIEKVDVEDTIKDLREQIRLLEIDNKALRESRDMFQNRNAELMKTINRMKKSNGTKT
jgi:ParB-like chromosome segregation protein Spo0J